jgi:hypothetical protein
MSDKKIENKKAAEAHKAHDKAEHDKNKAKDKAAAEAHRADEKVKVEEVLASNTILNTSSFQDAQHTAEATHNAQKHKAEAVRKDAERKAEEKMH